MPACAAQSGVVVVMMADLSDEFSNVEAMVQRVESGVDVVCPSRYMRGGRQVGGPWLKNLLSRTAGISLCWLTGLPTHDPTNSFKAYRKQFLDQHPIESTAGFCLGMEMTVKAHFLGGNVEELPTTWLDRTEGESRFQLWKTLPMYLHWYGWALNHSRRAAGFALAVLLTVAIAFIAALIWLKPQYSFHSDWAIGEPGNELYRAQRISEGALLYRDVASQYGPLATYMFSGCTWLFGDTIATGLGWQFGGASLPW